MPVVKTIWYQAGLRFSCTQCGNCCSGAPGYVWVTREEIRAIAEFLGQADGKLDKSQVRRVALRQSLTEKPDGDCIFLVRENNKTSCAIHSVRPKQCRTWPYWESNLRTPHDWNTAAKNCPGMGHGQHHSFESIEEARLQK